ncbi:MAG: hypothetical protein E7617_05285 [Ruminococcaceae bacterium]|nr:hypothetical protein [Oscillospiraceae bacterium]
MVDHKFVNGICTACGRNSSITKVAMTDNSESEKVWSMEKIYEIALNYGFEDTYNSFVYYLDGTTLSSARIDSLGRIHLTVSFENTKGEIVNLPIAKNFERVSVKNTSAPIGTLLYADIVDRELLLTYKNGIRVSAGSLNGSASSHITGFAINASNELVIYYSDNLIAYAGLIS